MNILLRYLAWRVMVGLHESITLSFLLVGHTKPSPDWCFGQVKRLYRRSQVNCLNEIVKVVESSARCNVAQLIGNQKGDIIVPSFDWLTFFSPHFRHFKDIKIVSAKGYEDSKPMEVDILRDNWQPMSTDELQQMNCNKCTTTNLSIRTKY